MRCMIVVIVDTSRWNMTRSVRYDDSSTKPYAIFRHKMHLFGSVPMRLAASVI